MNFVGYQEYTVSGWVLDEQEMGVLGVTITFVSEFGYDFEPVVTGENGLFVKEGLAGPVDIIPVYPDHFFDSKSWRVEEAESDIYFFMDDEYRVIGLVEMADETALANIAISFEPDDDITEPVFTDESGKFEVWLTKPVRIKPESDDYTFEPEYYDVDGFSDLLFVAEPDFAGGTGTAEDPYLVETAEQLRAVCYLPDKHYRQIEDIDLNGEQWFPIGWDERPFTGTYDGDGHKVFNLDLDLPQTYATAVGLFGYIDNAVIRDLCVQGVGIFIDSGGAEIGGLVGYAEDSEISGCAVFMGIVDVEVSGENVGGLVGKSVRTSISNCLARVGIQGTTGIGGLVGTNDSGSSITNSFAACYINTEASFDPTTAGGLVGINLGTVTNSYYDDQFATDTGKGSPKPYAEMKRQETFEGWDFINIWGIIEDGTYPYQLNFGPMVETWG